MSYHRLEIRDLTVSYKRVPAVHHVSLELRCGSCVGLLGPNGAGKTSLFKALVGLVPLETGSMSFHGHSRRLAVSEIAYLPQRSTVDWDFPITVRGMVEMGRYQALGWRKRFYEKDGRVVDQALETMELADLADRQISALSGGQQQRAFLARALAQEAHVFLLDEPFSGLDKPSQDLLAGAIRRLANAAFADRVRAFGCGESRGASHSGPCIVLVLGLIFLSAYLFSPKYGIVAKLLRPRHYHEASLARWNRRAQM